MPSPVSSRQPAASEDPPRRAHVHVPIAGLELEFVKAAMSGDVSVAGRGVQFAVDSFQVFGAVAGVQIHLALQSGDVDLAVAGPQVDAALARHLDNDVDADAGPIRC